MAVNSTNGKTLSAKAELENAKKIIINSIAETMDIYGVTPSVGRLYGTMYLQQEPMNLDELKDDMGMSKPSMSTGVRTLQDNNMVQKQWAKGSRRAQYVAEKDFFKTFVHFFCKRWEREANENLEAVLEAEQKIKNVLAQEELDEETRQDAESCLERIEESKVYYRWLKRLVHSFYSNEIFAHIPKEE
ncbi:choline uptake/conversion transcriptional regulator CudC [Dethiobacter alkaliphilus]|uniref:choline uptake/conversion transcriptional regulator CudC n=1 Tax=Dethiobacter alkaliphilus TaxID=427926 RepID=UPI002226D316|nr:GbsR/MarR family transcriptional regulator [Dethiobacter alkaliphilus]MCW3489064.1 GbsR/MarR family transcriptional regulator [Dethiobacter alkaliphilus]